MARPKPRVEWFIAKGPREQYPHAGSLVVLVKWSKRNFSASLVDDCGNGEIFAANSFHYPKDEKFFGWLGYQDRMPSGRLRKKGKSYRDEFHPKDVAGIEALLKW